MATETAVDVVMPQMGVSVSEGTITKWLKQQGEQVEADEPLLEISTDKVDTEVPAPASGTLTQILQFIESGGPAAPAEAPAPEAPPAEPKPAPAAPPPPAAAPAVAQTGESLEPMTAMRRGIAEHMRRSLDTAAHVTSAIEV